MYKFKVDIDKEEYNKFISKYSMAPITQDYRWANVKKDWEHTLCALYKDNSIVGVALLLIKKFPLNLKSLARYVQGLGILHQKKIEVRCVYTMYLALHWLERPF